jgi:hypothetical protein
VPKLLFKTTPEVNPTEPLTTFRYQKQFYVLSKCGTLLKVPFINELYEALKLFLPDIME